MIQSRESGTETEYITVDPTTEGVLSSMWHKITNFFSPISDNATDTTQTSNESTSAAGSTAKSMAAREIRRGNAPYDYRRTPEDRENVMLDEGGVLAPLENFRRISRSFRIEKIFDDEAPASKEVRQTTRKKRFIPWNSREADYADAFENKDENGKVKRPANKQSQPIVEEFDQGQIKNNIYTSISSLEDILRGNERTKEMQSNVWITEKIAVGSDAEENIDNENYIKNIQDDPLLILNPRFEPVVKELMTEE
ncbi:hypothetical protein NPIL_595621 [Nephila pilipes]|uniref:Uncharacterized protein n=1 Tax=Nephila pilipes TaxID=299642 RepID=A0A8X6N0L8_NEPPI|nr:hypothetical protein NPIL_595621 [Nephila pilipes]